MATLSGYRFGFFRPLIGATVAGVLAASLAACTAGGSDSPTAPPVTTTTSAAAATGPGAANGAATVRVTAGPGWKIYTDPSHRISFELPAQWIAQQAPARPGAAAGAIGVNVRDPSGSLVATFQSGIQGLGGACPPASARPYTVLASVPMKLPSEGGDVQSVPPRFVYRLLQGSNKFYGSYGITDHAAGADGKACRVYNVVSSRGIGTYMFGDVLAFSILDNPPAGLQAFSTIAEAQKYMKGKEFASLRRMITSLKIAP